VTGQSAAKDFPAAKEAAKSAITIRFFIAMPLPRPGVEII